MNPLVSVHIGDEIGRYGFGDHHPFGPHRMRVFWDEAQRQGLHMLVRLCDPVAADQSILELFHKNGYVEQVKRQSVTGSGYLDDGDTPAFVGVYQAASHVVGSVVDAVDSLMSGRYRRAFIPIAGLHHARPERASGFCVFNDCGVAIRVLRQQFGVRRVAYVDIDAHHGDGVFYPFEEDPDLIFADIHEDGRYLYPGTGHADETGRGAAIGTKLNIPLPPGADDDLFFQNWPRVEALLRQYHPEFIILQCGTDSILGDPITHLAFSTAAHAHAAARLAHLAEEIGHGRLLAVGGGGYNTLNIAKGWCAVVRSLVETPMRSDLSISSRAGMLS
ncbi:MAG: acetoin utilization protein AcuC [Magnetococcales bacterium]|nr:acetoin utilization protein AcuC [Magnetococcales bacterium]